jgi:ferredoxin
MKSKFLSLVRPEDVPLFQALFKELSPTTIYYRFFGPLRELKPEMLARFTQIDYDRKVALVAIDEDAPIDRLLGVARIIGDPDRKTGEFAVLVGDAWQGKGIGSNLLEKCLSIAEKQGFKTVHGIVLKENKLRPVDCATDGIFICGLAHSPKPIDESISQAVAAATRAVTLLARKTIHTSGTTAETVPSECCSCGVCVSICPYSAPSFIEATARFNPGKAQINPVLCKGCGLCVASCRSGAIRLKGFDNDQIFAQIFALN